MQNNRGNWLLLLFMNQNVYSLLRRVKYGSTLLRVLILVLGISPAPWHVHELLEEIQLWSKGRRTVSLCCVFVVLSAFCWFSCVSAVWRELWSFPCVYDDVCCWVQNKATKPRWGCGGTNNWLTEVGFGLVYRLSELIREMCCPTASEIKSVCREAEWRAGCHRGRRDIV